ncbi:MAG: electron transport complex subunit RsxE [Oscillospiraceae bacterium]|nr:electron transport complex subunit RsxE [Oscillospiraceae bacterium]
MTYIRTLLNGIFEENPVFVLVLGLAPALFVSTSVVNAVGLGVATLIVLICSNVVISLLRKFIPNKIRLLSQVAIIACFVTIVQILLNTYFPDLARDLGIFVPLIVVNGIIVYEAAIFATEHSPLESFIKGAAIGLGFLAALIVMAFFRELLGNGTILGFAVFGERFDPASIMIMPPGAFLTLGIGLAIFAAVKSRGKENE